MLARVVSAASALAQTQSTGSGQAYPAKPVRLVVPAPPGGGTDILARVIAPKLSEGLGQSVIVENRGGAAGNIAAELVAKSPPDGYTLIIVNTAFRLFRSLYRNLPFDPVRDFAPVTHLMISPPCFWSRTLPSRSRRCAASINLAKARPGELNFASSGSGQSNHLAAELFKSMQAKDDMVHVPYKGGGPVLTDLLGGHITLFFGSITSTLPHTKSGKLRPLGVTSLKRAHAAPDVPTIAEAALPGFEAVGWYGILAPAGTSKEILNRLSRDVVRGLQAPEVQDRIIKDGGEPVGGTPDQFSAFIRAEIAKWAEVVRVIRRAGRLSDCSNRDEQSFDLRGSVRDDVRFERVHGSRSRSCPQLPEPSVAYRRAGGARRVHRFACTYPRAEVVRGLGPSSRGRQPTRSCDQCRHYDRREIGA